MSGISNEYVDYWEKAVPWTFREEKLSYEERRARRYLLQDYMAQAIGFGRFKGKRVLELGSGSGIDSAEFARNGANVVSLDFTSNGTQGTRDVFREAGLESNPIRADNLWLPFRESSFDGVYSFGVLHHIPEVDRVVAEIARVLRPGGELMCMLYNKDSLLYSYSILFTHRDEGLTEDQLISRYSERILGCPYTKAYTKADARELFEPRFSHVDVSVHFNVIDLPDVRKHKLNIPDRYELGWHLIVKARK